MKCPRCKGEVEYLFTDDNWNEVCQKCLEKSIYEERKLYNNKLDNLTWILALALFGCILVIIGFLIMFTTPQKEPKQMTIYECLETMGDYALCERKMRSNNE